MLHTSRVLEIAPFHASLVVHQSFENSFFNHRLAVRTFQVRPHRIVINLVGGAEQPEVVGKYEGDL